jgi:hypothetical protein
MKRDLQTIQAASPKDLPYCLKPAEVAAWCGCSVRSVLDAVRRGDLRAYKRNARVMTVKKPDAIRWVEGGAA